MSDPACTPLPVPDLNSTYGAMLIGVLFATFLQGLLTLQAIIYYGSYPQDPISTKLIVATAWCLDTFHLVLIAQSVYHYLVNNWGSFPALMISTWELDLNLTLIGLSSFVCQVFFLNRIWIFSKKNIPLIGFLTTLCVTTLALDILVTVQITQNRSVLEFGRRKGEIIAVFTSGAIADVVLASLLCYYIRRNRSGFEKTDSLVTSIVKYTITTGLVTSLLGIFTLIAYFASPNGFIFIAMHFSLGRMYTNALLATLNSRKRLRAALRGTSTKVPSRSRQDKAQNSTMSIPLSTFEIPTTQGPQIQVHKSTEVIQSGYSYNFRDYSEEQDENGISKAPQVGDV
ncbi:hypothetical protein F5879DRAFT_976653 [Lentinula edodes]|nr:hypothetical protein F5879DRAFT_976653 [Lentinula edodes]